MTMFVVYALTHAPSGYVYVGVAKHEGEAAELFLAHPLRLLNSTTEVTDGDTFSLKVLDQKAELEDADGIAQGLIDRLREMEGVKVLNPDASTPADKGEVFGPPPPPAGASMRSKALAAGLKYTTVVNRIKRGWTEAQALGQEPPPPRGKRTGTPKRLVTIGEVTKPYSKWCEENDIAIETALARERLGWSVERAVTTRVKERR